MTGEGSDGTSDEPGRASRRTAQRRPTARQTLPPEHPQPRRSPRVPSRRAGSCPLSPSFDWSALPSPDPRVPPAALRELARRQDELCLLPEPTTSGSPAWPTVQGCRTRAPFIRPWTAGNRALLAIGRNADDPRCQSRGVPMRRAAAAHRLDHRAGGFPNPRPALPFVRERQPPLGRGSRCSGSVRGRAGRGLLCPSPYAVKRRFPRGWSAVVAASTMRCTGLSLE